MSKLKNFPHKKLVIILIIFGAAGYGYYRYKKSKNAAGETRYVTAEAQKSTLIVSVSGSGQVSSSDQIEIKSKVSGNITRINAAEGQKIKEGEIIANIDSREAEKAVRDAKLAYDTASIELQELLSPADELDIIKAENDLKTAQSNLEKLLSPADKFSFSQAQNDIKNVKNSLENLKYSQEKDYQNAINAKQEVEDSLNRACEETYDSIANIFLDLPETVTKLRNILYSYEIAQSDSSSAPCYCENATVLLNSIFGDNRFDLESFINKAKDNYENTRQKFDKNFKNCKNTDRYSAPEAIDTLLNETSETIKSVSETIKNEMNMLDFWVDCRNKDNQKTFSKITSYQSDLKSYTSKTSSYLSNISSLQKSIKDSRENKSNAGQNIEDLKKSQPQEIARAEWAIEEKENVLQKLNEKPEESEIESAEITIQEKEAALENLRAGANSLDIRTKKNSLQQKADTLSDAEQALNDCAVRAPFSGIIGKLNTEKGEEISLSASIATLITDKQIAEISLNEIDAAKIKIGNKANMAFDAVPDLSITGQIIGIDSIGTITQGVVTYMVKIAMDIQNEQIKPGMSVSASIIIDSKQNALSISNSAIKQANETSYVEIMENGAPRRQIVEIGISNDASTEIISGISEGDSVVTQTIAANISGSSASSPQSASLRIPGLGGNNSEIIRNIGRYTHLLN